MENLEYASFILNFFLLSLAAAVKKKISLTMWDSLGDLMIFWHLVKESGQFLHVRTFRN